MRAWKAAALTMLVFAMASTAMAASSNGGGSSSNNGKGSTKQTTGTTTETTTTTTQTTTTETGGGNTSTTTTTTTNTNTGGTTTTGSTTTTTTGTTSGSSGTSGGATTGTTTTTSTSTATVGTDPYPFVQSPYNTANGFEVRFNGSNVNTTGLDYQSNGTDLNVVTRPTANTDLGITYSDPVLISGKYYIFEQKTVTAQDGSTTTSRTGTAYQLQGTNPTTATQAVLVVPGISSVESNVGQITGTSSTEATGINILHQKDTDQLMGGYNNTQAYRGDALDALIESSRTSATAFYNLNTGKWENTTDGSAPFLGTLDDPVIAYARGIKDPVTGAIQEKIGFHESQLTGVGLLVVEIDNPDLAQFELSGQSQWTGLVVVVMNKVPQKNSSRIMQIGGNTGTAVIGGAFLYFRNEARSTDTSNLINTPAELGMISGNASIKFSEQAIDMVFKSKPSAMVVRSWRKLAENE